MVHASVKVVLPVFNFLVVVRSWITEFDSAMPGQFAVDDDAEEWMSFEAERPREVKKQAHGVDRAGGTKAALENVRKLWDFGNPEDLVRSFAKELSSKKEAVLNEEEDDVVVSVITEMHNDDSMSKVEGFSRSGESSVKEEEDRTLDKLAEQSDRDEGKPSISFLDRTPSPLEKGADIDTRETEKTASHSKSSSNSRNELDLGVWSTLSDPSVDLGMLMHQPKEKNALVSDESASRTQGASRRNLSGNWRNSESETLSNIEFPKVTSSQNEKIPRRKISGNWRNKGSEPVLSNHNVEPKILKRKPAHLKNEVIENSETDKLKDEAAGKHVTSSQNRTNVTANDSFADDSFACVIEVDEDSQSMIDYDNDKSKSDIDAMYQSLLSLRSNLKVNLATWEMSIQTLLIKVGEMTSKIKSDFDSFKRAEQASLRNLYDALENEGDLSRVKENLTEKSSIKIYNSLSNYSDEISKRSSDVTSSLEHLLSSFELETKKSASKISETQKDVKDNSIPHTKDKPEMDTASISSKKQSKIGNQAAMKYLAEAVELMTSSSADDHVKAFDIFTDLQNTHGMLEATYELAICYRYGKGTEQDFRKAFRLYHDAAKRSHPGAMNSLGWCYRNGKGCSQDWGQAIYWYSLAAENKDVRGMINLASCYENGFGVSKSPKKAFSWYKRAADAGYNNGICSLGECYENGLGVEKNLKLAFDNYSRAAELGSSRAFGLLGKCYQNGFGTEKDLEKAFSAYAKGAEAGDAQCMNNLGFFYQKGIGTDRDSAQAVYWFKKAAAAGSSDAFANLAWCHQKGDGVDENMELAAKLYLQASKLGNAAAMNITGYLYQEGVGFPQDKAEAFKWYKMSAENGEKKAMTILGWCYQNGMGTDKNDMMAAKWFLLAAEAGDLKGMLLIAHHLETGKGISKNESKAFKWYLAASEAGSPKAMYSLSRCFEKGLGTSADPAKAKEWLQEAANLGYTKAKQRLEFLLDS